MEIRFTIPGRPVSKARPRLGAGGRTYTPKPTKMYEHLVKYCVIKAIQDWKAAARLAVLRQPSLPGTTGPKSPLVEWPRQSRYRVEATIYLPDMRGDVDNVAKSILDGMQGIAYDDDKYVMELWIEKRINRAEPRADVVVIALGG